MLKWGLVIGLVVLLVGSGVRAAHFLRGGVSGGSVAIGGQLTGGGGTLTGGGGNLSGG